MQQWKVSKARLHTGYRLSGRSERNSAGPTLENINRASSTPKKMSRARPRSLGLSSPSASSVDLAREVTPGPIESVMSSSPSSSPEHDVQAKDSPEPISIGTEEAPGSKLASYAGSSGSLNDDYGDEPLLAVKACQFLDELEPRFQDLQEVVEKAFPIVERKLKARIELRKGLNQRLRARIAAIEKCKKYAATLMKLEEELNATRAETDVLEGSVRQAVETADHSLDEWIRLTTAAGV